MVDFPIPNTSEIVQLEFPVNNLDDATASDFSMTIAFLNLYHFFMF